MRRPKAFMFLFASLFSGFSTAASAQIGAQFTSLESLVANADSVVRGTIRKTSRHLLECKFTVAITEVLKGDKKDEVTLSRKTTNYKEQFEEYEQWRDAQSEFLWFLNNKDDGDGTNASEKWLVVRLSQSAPAGRGYNTCELPIFSMDFTVLKHRDEILAAARRAAAILDKSNRKPIESITVSIPRSVASKCGRSGDVNSFTVPLIEEMQPIAQKMVNAPEALNKDFNRPEYQPELLQLSGLKILTRLLIGR